MAYLMTAQPGVSSGDLDRFDLILIMDKDNYEDILYLDPSKEQLSKVHFLREFDPEGGLARRCPIPITVVSMVLRWFTR